MAEKKFWLVWSPHGEKPPKWRHKTYWAAQREAKRLSKKSLLNYYVMEAISLHEHQAIPYNSLLEI